MENERKLAGIASAESRWLEATQQVLNQDSIMVMQVEHHAQVIVDEVITGELAVNDLRTQVTMANDLDREAVEVADGAIENLAGDDLCEAVARRIAHHSGRQALNMVKNKRRRQSQQIHYQRQKRFGEYALNG